MKITKSAMCFVLCLVMIISSGILAFANDAPSQWAQEQVNAAIAANLVPQQLQSHYTQAITRAEFSALAVRLYETVRGEITGRVSFTDTNDTNVQKMAYLEVVSGVGNNRFDPNGTLTREQAAVMLTRLAAAMWHPFLSPRQTASFADMENVATWAVEGVTRVHAAGIMGGVGGNNFAPNLPYTREQSIVTMLRMFEMVNANDVPIPHTPGGVQDPPGIGHEPAYEIGRVIITANGVEHEPYAHFAHSTTRYMSVSGIPFVFEAVTRQLQEIQYASDFQIVIEGQHANAVSFSLHDEYFNVIYEGKDSFVPPTEAGVFLFSVGIRWSNIEIDPDSATFMLYIFKIRV